MDPFFLLLEVLKKHEEIEFTFLNRNFRLPRLALN